VFILLEELRKTALENIKLMTESYTGYNWETIVRGIKLQLETVESHEKFEKTH